MLDHVNKLLEMAEYFKLAGERDLEKSCRDTATKICDHVLYVKQKERTNVGDD